MNAEDYIYYMRNAIARGKYPSRNYSNGYSASTVNDENSMWTTRYLLDGESVPEGYKSMVDPLDNTKTIVFQDNDFQKRFFKPSTWQNYYLGANGGTENVKYAASIGYTDDGGIGIGTGFTRFTMKGNTDFKINEKLSFATVLITLRQRWKTILITNVTSFIEVFLLRLHINYTTQKQVVRKKESMGQLLLLTGTNTIMTGDVPRNVPLFLAN